MLFLILTVLVTYRCPSPIASDKSVPRGGESSIGCLVRQRCALGDGFRIASSSLVLRRLPLISILPIFGKRQLIMTRFVVRTTSDISSM